MFYKRRSARIDIDLTLGTADKKTYLIMEQIEKITILFDLFSNQQFHNLTFGIWV